MDQEIRDEAIKFYSTIREEYENRIGWKMKTDSRLRVQVEARVALAVAIRPYGTLREVAELIGKKDHSTVVHSLKSHETHFRWSPNYRAKYKIALETVRDVARMNDIDPHFNEFTLDGLRREVGHLKDILDMNIDTINKFYQEAEQKKEHWMRKLENEILSLPSEV